MTTGFTSLLNSYEILPEYALSQPSDDRNGVLGQTYNLITPDVPDNLTQRIYVLAHAALTAGVPYQLKPGVDGSAWITAAVQNAPQTNAIIVVPTFNIGSGQYAYVAIIGEVTAAVTGTVAAGDYLKLVKNTAAFAPNGTTGSTTYTSATIGIVLAARTGAGNTRIRLTGGFLTSPISDT